jgi:F-type H+-transporting ATPase subunit b
MAVAENILAPDWKAVATNAIAFIAAVLILRHFAWGRMMDFLDARRKRIQDSFDDIDRGRADLSSRESEYRARVERIEDEARALKQSEVEEGRRLADAIRERARLETEERLEDARQTIEIAKMMAEASLREDMVRMSLAAAEKLIGASMDEDVDRKLVEQAIDELSEMKSLD